MKSQQRKFNQFTLIIFIQILIVITQTAVPSDCNVYIKARSAGYKPDPNIYEVYVNDVRVPGHAAGRGLNFVQIDQFTGEMITTKQFDTCCASNAADQVANMIDYINKIPTGRIVVIGVRDEGTYSMTTAAWNALVKLGVPQDYRFAYRDGFVLIGGKELKASGKAVYARVLATSGQIAQQELCVSKKISSTCSNHVSVVSGGQLDWENLQYYVNYQKQDVSFSGRGHNVVIFDKYDASIVKDKKKFDTYAISSNPNVITEYVNYLSNISQGDIVLIAIEDEGGDNLTSAIYQQFATLGGPTAGSFSIGHRESFALIGTKGGAAGSAQYLKRGNGAGGVIVEKCIQGCSFQCTTCAGHKDTCTACTQRDNINSPSSCLCKDTYYENSSQSCSKCLLRCAKCVNASECTQCGNGLGRATTGNMCICQNGYYEKTGDNLDCGVCQYPCANCTGSPSNCTSCASQLNRNQNSSCQCQSDAFDNGTDCISCTYPCLSCSSPTVCKTCQTTANRVSVTDCSCQATYFETGSACQKCQYPCVNCTSINTCTSCVVDVNRSNSAPCGCNSGYFDNGSNCQKCHHKCSECTSFETCKANSCSDSTRDPAQNCECRVGKFDKGVAICDLCSYKCSTCTLSAENCSTCAVGTGRSTEKPCNCNQGYFDDGQENVNCVQCVHPCVNCTSLTNCDSCISRSNIDPKPSCQCQNRFYEKQDLTCSACTHPCKNCVDNDTKCTECVSTINRQSYPSCLCQDGYFDNGTDLGCQICEHPCLKCTGVSLNKCTECVVRDNANSFPNCHCKDGYYENNSKECIKCPLKFAKCTSPTNGTECAVGVGRSSSTPDCNCNDQFFDDLTNQADCVACVHPCINCNSLTVCESCVQRDFINNISQCTCLDGYYEKNDLSCEKCTHPCSKCVNSQTNCTECVSTVNRLSYPSCLCKDGFFDNGIDMGCQICEHPCIKCTGIDINQCTECVVRDNANSFPNCHCKDGYYENSSKQCIKCPGRFSKCSDENTGTECATGFGRSAVIPECKCESGYFDNNTNSNECIQCIHPCQSCTSLTVCDTCIARNNINQKPDCHCQSGYYEDSSSLACNICSHPCDTCIQISTKCESCVAGINRNPKPNCQCADGFYEDNNLVCQPCVYPCLKCSTLNICIDCQTPTNRNLPPLDNSTCDCEDGYFDNDTYCEKCAMQCSTCISEPTNCVDCSEETRHGGLCICKDGLYDIGVPKCQQCDYMCGTCIDTSDKCISCANDRRDINNNCKCKDGFYEDTNNICQPCQFPCVNCSNQFTCKSCHITGISELDVLRQPSGCLCKKGYYEDQETKNCLVCHSRCNSCIGNAENCIDCKIQLGRQLIAPVCACKEEMFYVSVNNEQEVCLPCNEGCKKCTKDTCLECNNKNAMPPSCQQIVSNENNYVSFSVNVDGQNIVVSEQCESQCSSCQNQVNNCTLCSAGLKRTMQTPECGCEIGYYSDINLIDCQKCNKYCKNCKSFELCDSCEQGLNRSINQKTGQCECQKGFKENNQLECQKCYQYQRDCLFDCPQSTIQDENLMICIDLVVESSNNSLLLLEILGITLFIMVFVKIVLIKYMKKGINKLVYKNIGAAISDSIDKENSQNKSDEEKQQEDQIML